MLRDVMPHTPVPRLDRTILRLSSTGQLGPFELAQTDHRTVLVVV